jgi:hypothetical protein
MPETENPTLSPPETPLPAESAPEAATPEPAAEPAEGVEEAAEPTVEAPTWDGLRESLSGLEEVDHDELFGLENVKPALEKRVQEAHDTAYSELQGHMQPLAQKKADALSKAAAGLEELQVSIERARQDEVLDARAYDDLVRRNRDLFQLLNNEAQGIGFWEGIRQYVSYLGQAAGDPNIEATFLPKVRRMEEGIPDPTFMKDLMTRLTKKARDEGHEEGFKAGKKSRDKAGAEAAKAETRSTGGPPTAPSTGGGKQYSDMTAEERAKLTPEQRDAYSAQVT